MAYFFKHISTLATLLVATLSIYAQNNISGHITNTYKEAVEGASVILTTHSGHSYGTATDENGYFTLKNINEDKWKISISHILYRKTEATQEDFLSHDNISITLKELTTVLDNVYISPTRAMESAPFAQEKIAKSEIEKENYGQNIPQLLQNMPSVVSTSDDGTGFGYSSMRIRGADATRTNVTINGIALNDSESGAVFWVNLPDLAANAQDISVQRGAGTSTNGSGAFGGSVNISTSSPLENASAALHYSAGSFATQHFSGEFSSGLLKNHFEVSGRLTRGYSDGYIERASSDVSSYFLQGGYYGSKTSAKIIAFGGKQTTYQAWNGIDAATLKTNRRFNSCGAIYDDSWSNVIGYYDNETDNYSQDHLQFIFSHKTGNWEIGSTIHYTFGRGYYESYKQDASLSRYGIEAVETPSGTIEYADVIPQKWLYNHYYGATAYTSYKGEKIKSTLSAAFSRYDGDHYGEVIWAQYSPNIPKGHRFYFNNTLKDDMNIFWKSEYNISSALSFYLDLQYRHLDYTMKGIEDKNAVIDFDNKYSFFNPKAGINYTPSDAHRFYMSYSRAAKEPNRSDYTDSDIEPRPEYLDDIEIGYTYNKPKINANINVYYMYYTDQLVPTGELDDSGYVIRSNVNKSYRLGVELSATYKPLNWLQGHISLSLSDNVIKGLETENGIKKNTKISYSPSMISSATISFAPIQNMNIDIIARYVGEQYMSNNNIAESLLDDYLVSDLSIMYNFKKGKVLPEITLRGKINNVFDTMYISNGAIYGRDAYYFPQAGINFMAGIDIKF